MKQTINKIIAHNEVLLNNYFEKCFNASTDNFHHTE